VKAFIGLGMIAASAAIIFGCTSSERSGSSSGNSTQALTAQRTQVGVVIKLREISLVDDRTLLNARAETQGRSIAQVGGAVLSAMTDESTDDHSVETDAQEITVQVESGAINMVTQPKTENLQLNQRVKVINAQQSTRVIAY
jgi:outer membrane lipoprotein SlyB